MGQKRWTIGITHLIKSPFDPELKAFSEFADIVYFSGRDADEYNAKQLERLDAMLVWTPLIGKTVAEKLSKCRILVRYGVGYDKIYLNALAQQDIAFSNNPEYGPEDVADTAMTMLLALQRRIIEHGLRACTYQHEWQENHLSSMRHCCVRNCTT
jgi:lactate dehydrogenase-like 2-hydroxyacid dehydrogenase